MIERGGPCPFFSYTLARALKVRKSMKNQSGQPASHCINLAAILGAASNGLLSISPPWLPTCEFSQPLVGTSAFHVAELRGSLPQLTLSQSLQSTL
jgi:hypothetical protein